MTRQRVKKQRIFILDQYIVTMINPVMGCFEITQYNDKSDDIHELIRNYMYSQVSLGKINQALSRIRISWQ